MYNKVKSKRAEFPHSVRIFFALYAYVTMKRKVPLCASCRYGKSSRFWEKTKNLLDKNRKMRYNRGV